MLVIGTPSTMQFAAVIAANDCRLTDSQYGKLDAYFWTSSSA